MKPPLFVGYRSQSGVPYLYDSKTGEIIRVPNDVYEVAADFHLLGNDELIAKHARLGRGNVERALELLSLLQTDGLMQDHEPTRTPRPRAVLCPEAVSWAGFLATHRQILTLEVTQKCNLRCTYCVYGDYYKTRRRHGNTSMPWEVARRAVLAFLDCQRGEDLSISFYGGEPLLEFALIKRIIALADNYARERGVAKPSFHLTTNGTLLTDDIIHYMVANDVSVAISLDGAQQSHDRYRVFSHPGNLKSIGSFTTVMRNVDRFIALYPNYDKRFFQITLTATNDIQQSDSFLKRYSESFPVVTFNFVRDVEGLGEGKTLDYGYGCAFVPGLKDEGYSGGGSDCRSGKCWANAPIPECPDFSSWSDAHRKELGVLLQGFVEDYLASPETAAKDHPLLSSILRGMIKQIHARSVTRTPFMEVNCYRCLPGSTRLFCSVEGNYYPCERGDNTDLSLLGNVWEGFDGTHADNVSEFPTGFTDCDNCVIKRLCSLCLSIMRGFQVTKGVDGVFLRRRCESMKDNCISALITYTSIMERNQSAFDAIADDVDLVPPWVKDLRFLLPSRPLSAEELGIEEL